MNVAISHCLLPQEEFGARKEDDKKQLQLQASSPEYTSSNKNISWGTEVQVLLS